MGRYVKITFKTFKCENIKFQAQKVDFYKGVFNNNVTPWEEKIRGYMIFDTNFGAKKINMVQINIDTILLFLSIYLIF